MKRIITFLALLALVFNGCTSSNSPPLPDSPSPVEKKYAGDDPAYKQMVRNADLPLVVAKIWPSKPQGKEGISANLLFENISEKTIQDVYFLIQAMNDEQLPIFSEAGRSDQVNLKFSIEMEPGKVGRSTWGPIWPESSIADIRILTIRIIYQDKTIQTITETDAIDLMTMPGAFQTEEVPLFQKVD